MAKIDFSDIFETDQKPQAIKSKINFDDIFDTPTKQIFTDTLGAAPEYVPSKEEMAVEVKREPQKRGPMRSELTQEEKQYRAEQAPFQRIMEQVKPLQGERTNAPMPPERPEEFKARPAAGEQPPIIVNPLLGAGESPVGQVRGAVNPETGEPMPYQPTEKEIERAKAAGVPVMQMLEGEAREDLPFRKGVEEPGRLRAQETEERRAEANQYYDETLKTMTENKKELEKRLQNYRDQYAAGKIKKTDLDSYERVIGKTIQDAQGEIDKARAEKVKWAQQAITQSNIASMAQHVPQTVANLTTDLATAFGRIGTSPVSVAEYLIYGDKIDPNLRIQNALSKQDAEIKRNIAKVFNADSARLEDFGHQLVGATASSAQFMVGGGALIKGLQLSMPVATAIMGALPQANQMWQMAEERAKKDPSVNQEWRKWTAFTLGLGIGSTEALPISRMFERLEHVSGGGLTRLFGMIGAGFGEEGIQEAGQQLLQNAVAMGVLNDPDATLTKDVANNMLIGALSGGLTAGVMGGGKMIAQSLKGAPPPQLPPEMMPPTVAPFSVQSPFVAQAQQAPAAPSSPTPQGAAVEAQGAVTPPSPAAPTVSRADAETLKGAGYSVEQILDMSPAEVAAEVKKAAAANVKPEALSQDEQNQITPPAPAVEQAPSAQAQALVEQGVPPLQAIAEVGQGAEQPQTPEGQKAKPEQNGFDRNPPKIGEVQPQFSAFGYRFVLDEDFLGPYIEVFTEDGHKINLKPFDTNLDPYSKYIDTFLREAGLPKELAEPLRDYMLEKGKPDNPDLSHEANVQNFINQTTDRIEGLFNAKEEFVKPPAAQEQVQPPVTEQKNEWPVLENVEGHRYLGMSPAEFIRLYGSPNSLVEKSSPAKNFFTRTGQSAIQLRIDPAAFTGTERAPAFVKEVIYNPNLLKFGNSAKAQQAGMARFNEYLSYLKNAGVKVTESMEPARARKKAQFSYNTPNSAMLAVGGIRADSLAKYLSKASLKEFPKGTINYKNDGSGQNFEDFANSLIEQEYLYPDFYAQVMNPLPGQNAYASPEMLETIIDDLRSNNWSAVEKKNSAPDAAQIEHYEHYDALRTRALFNYMLENYIKYDDELVVKALRAMEWGASPEDAWETAIAKKNTKFGILSEEDLRDFLGEDWYNVWNSETVQGVEPQGREARQQREAQFAEAERAEAARKAEQRASKRGPEADEGFEQFLAEFFGERKPKESKPEEVKPEKKAKPEEKAKPEQKAAVQKDSVLKSAKIEVSERAGKFYVAGKGTFNLKGPLKELGGKWDAANKAWRFDNDPTQAIADAIARAGGEGGEGGAGTGTNIRTDAERLAKKAEQDARPDERLDDYSNLVQAKTKSLIETGTQFGIPEDVVKDQIQDVGMIVHAFDTGKPMFLLANEAGTGKTFVLGGAIRELAPKVKNIVYVTMNQNLIAQIKKDLDSYGIGKVDFTTYSKLSDINPAQLKDGLLIFDEAHNVKNIDVAARAKSAADLIKQAKMTVFASATPFQNPVEARYLGPTGIFDNIGGHADWAKLYGAQTRTFKQEGRTIEQIYWTGGKKHQQDGIDARNWLLKQGVMIQRGMKIDPKMVDVQFHSSPVSAEVVSLYNRVNAAYDAAIEEADGDNKIIGEIKRHRENVIKRLLEAGKAPEAIARTKEYLKDGKNVVIFTETKADRGLGRFRRSERFKDDRLYTYSQMRSMMNDWEHEAGQARMMNERPPPRPFAKFIVQIAEAFHDAGIDTQIPSTVDDVVQALGGKDKVAIYTGDVSDAAAQRNKEDFLSGRKKVLVATMAKGGTGLSLHDKVGNRPTVQININLPWVAHQVDQVSGRVARYGLQSKAVIEWLFASNIPWEAHTLAPKVGARMADMGAIIKGIDVKAANALLGGFDEGSLDVKQQAAPEEKPEEDEESYFSIAERKGPVEQIDHNEKQNLINNAVQIMQRVAGNFANLQFVELLSRDDMDIDAARRSGFTGTDEEFYKAKGFAQRASDSVVNVVIATAHGEDMLPTAYHEADHVLSMLGLYTPEERKARELAIPRLKNFLLDNGYTKESVNQMSNEEVLAYANALYSTFRDAGVSPDKLKLSGPIRKIYDKILRIVEGIRNWLAGHGYKNIEDLMSNQYLGQIAQRSIQDMNERVLPQQGGKMFSFDNATVNKINAMNIANGAKPKPTARATATFVTPAHTAVGEAAKIFQDEFNYLQNIQYNIEIARGSPLPDSLNAYIIQSLMPGIISEKLDNFRTMFIEPLISYMKENNINPSKLGMYLMAKHAEERNAKMAQRDPSRFGTDGGSGMMNKTAQDILTEFKNSGEDVVYEKAADMVYRIIKQDNLRRLESGLIDQATYDGYEKDYKYYVPLRGFAERDAEEDSLMPHFGKGITASGKEYKTALGRRSISDNPFINAIIQAEEGIYRVEKNTAAKALMRLAQAHPNDELWSVDKLPKKRVLGSDGVVKFVPDMANRYGNNVVVAKIGGETHFVILKDESLAQAYRKFGAVSLHPIFRKIADTTRFFSTLATSRNPAFFIPNVVRDLQEALFTAFNENPALAKNFLANYPAAMALAIRVAAGRATPQQLGIYDVWRLSGGKISYNSFKELETIAREIEDLLAGADPLNWSNLPAKTQTALLGSVKKVLGMMDKISEPLENATRLAVFMAAKQTVDPDAPIKGRVYSDQKAASLARESTVNFNRRGSWGSAMNGLWMFYNASVQGNAKILQLLTRKDKIGSRARAAYASLVPLGFFATLMNLAVSGNDPAEKWKKNYANIPEYMRRGYIIIKYGPKEDDYFRMLPLAFGLKVPYYFGEQLAMMMMGQVTPEKALSNVLVNALETYSPVGSGDLFNMLSPTLIDPIYEMFSNKAQPTGAPIVPKETEYNKGIPRSQQYFSTTSPVSVGIAQFLNEITGGSSVRPGGIDLYPGWFDYSAKWMTSGLGSTAKGLYDWAKNSIDGVPTPAEKIPIVKGFAPAATSEGRKFYEMHEQIDEKVNRLRAAKRKLEINPKDESARADFRSLAKELGATVENGKIVWKEGPVGTMEKADKAIVELRKQATAIRANDKLTPIQRKEKLDAVDKRIEGIMVKVRGVMSKSLPERKPTFAPLSGIVQ